MGAFTFQQGVAGPQKPVTGFDTGVAGMHVGGKRRLFIPWQLAYGSRGNPPTIPAQANLVFDIELVGQSDNAPEQKTPPAAPPAAAMPATPQSVPATAAPAQPPAAAAPKRNKRIRVLVQNIKTK